jgi:hypothetical protein
MSAIGVGAAFVLAFSIPGRIGPVPVAARPVSETPS